MNTRRDFIKTVSGAGALAAFGNGCALCGPCRSDASAANPPYRDVIRDRLWMWGHGGTAFEKPHFSYGIPSGEPIEMNDACKYLGIPNVCVCRYEGLPEKKDCSAYLKTFKDIKRIAFSIVDNAPGTWQEKYELAKTLRKENPNLTTVWLDDFFTPHKLSRPGDIYAFREMLTRDGFKLACVLYPDSDGIKPEFKKVLSLCDQISVWFWNAKNIPSMKTDVAKVRELVGPEKAIVMGIYMWDFGGRREVPDELMHRQLDTGLELMRGKELSGLVFHPTSLVNKKVSSVEIARRWIAKYGDTPA
jgi:hypothetical protein